MTIVANVSPFGQHLVRVMTPTMTWKQSLIYTLNLILIYSNLSGISSLLDDNLKICCYRNCCRKLS